MHTQKLTTLLVLAILALPACGTLQSTRTASKPVTEPASKPIKSTVITPGENASAAKPANPVTLALRNDAEAALNKGDLTGATRLLERALRVDARDADTYLIFARLRNTQGDRGAALQLIDKGLSLRPSNTTAKALRKLKQSIEAAAISS